MCIQLKQKQMRGKRCVTASRLFNQFSKVLRFLKAVLHRRSRDTENMKSEVHKVFLLQKIPILTPDLAISESNASGCQVQRPSGSCNSLV